MKKLFACFLTALFMLAAVFAKGNLSLPNVRTLFGVVTQESAMSEGVLVKSVASGSPAEAAGLRAADRILSIDDESVGGSDSLRGIITAHIPGDVVKVEVQRGGKQFAALAELSERGDGGMAGWQQFPAAGAGPVTYERRLVLPAELLMQIFQAQNRIREQLLSLPGAFSSGSVIRDMQELRNLAAGSSPGFDNWMSGASCEAFLEFSDGYGRVVLHGFDGNLRIEEYDGSGQLQAVWPVNTEAQRKALPSRLINRLQSLK